MDIEQIKALLLADPAVESVHVESVSLVRVFTTAKSSALCEDRHRIYGLENSIAESHKDYEFDFHVTG